jgi:hypothetical protein
MLSRRLSTSIAPIARSFAPRVSLAMFTATSRSRTRMSWACASALSIALWRLLALWAFSCHTDWSAASSATLWISPMSEGASDGRL